MWNAFRSPRPRPIAPSDVACFGSRLHDWAVAGLGIMLKSEVDVAGDLAAGRLERVLPDWDGGQASIVALYPSAQFVPLKTRVLLDRLAAHIAVVMNARPDAYPECTGDARYEAVAANRT
jgi:DNA-binding transcriptional LysR family regulator